MALLAPNAEATLGSSSQSNPLGIFARRGRYAEAARDVCPISRRRWNNPRAVRPLRRATRAYIAVASGSDRGRELSERARESAHRSRAQLGGCVSPNCSVPTAGPPSRSSAPCNQSVRRITLECDVSSQIWCVGGSMNSISRVGRGNRRRSQGFTQVDGGSFFGIEIAIGRLGEGYAAARLLEPIGDVSDILRLREYARRQRKRSWGIATLVDNWPDNLAERVVHRGSGAGLDRSWGAQDRGSMIRRKVLALLCFLLTRPDMSSTRDQVLDALWPELDPVDALNSLNQTVYFLRRVLEERYVDDLSPGYLHHDSDLIWLDAELVSSRSNDCRRLIKSFPPTPAPDQVKSLGRGIQRSVRARFRIRGVGGSVPRLASRLVPGDRRASRE